MFVFEIGPLLKEFCNSFTKGLGVRKNRGKCNWVFWREAISLSAQDSKGRGINITKWFLRKRFGFQHFCLLAQEEHQALRQLKASTKLPVQRWAKPALLLSPSHPHGEFYFSFFIYFRGEKMNKMPKHEQRKWATPRVFKQHFFQISRIVFTFLMFTIRSRAYAFGHQLLKLVFTGKKYGMQSVNSCKCTVSLCVS